MQLYNFLHSSNGRISSHICSQYNRLSFIFAHKKTSYHLAGFYYIFKTTYMLTFPWELTSCVADWVLYSAGITSWLRHSVSFASQMSSLYHECSSTSKLAPSHSCYILPALSAFWSSPHPISNSQLHALLHFHLCPIYLVVFKGVYFLTNGISHLKGGFTLRCLQRLSLPGLATRP